MPTSPSPVEYLVAFATCVAIGVVIGWRAKARQVDGKPIL